MLVIDFGTKESYNSSTNVFETVDIGLIRFEYSLKALYEWEGVWLKPFKPETLSDAELLDFYHKMALDNFNPTYFDIPSINKLSEYVGKANTATKFSAVGGQNGNKLAAKTYTSEEVYGLMAEYNIPLEFENRNLNRLFTIIKVMDERKRPPTKMNRQEILQQNAELNRQRREAMKTRG